jgi:phospholipid/cholesterol/gamma-HCH transport system permease protein
LLDILKGPVEAMQDFVSIAGRATQNVFRAPHYVDDIALQMDSIGVGSLPVVILTGFFTGAVMAMQLARALSTYGATDQVPPILAITLVRELGPVLTALMVSGRNASGIASELGSMTVTEQIDAMRALGTDPIQKLVTPRLIATATMLPLLTIISDFMGMVGGYFISRFLLAMQPAQYWNTAWQSLQYNDVVQGILKPFIFAIIISLVGCYYGISTTGGTQGVGRSTTQAVVVSSIWIIVATFFIGRIFLNLS